MRFESNMNSFGWLDRVALIFVLLGGIVSIIHIQNETAHVFGITCIMFGLIWLVFAYRYGLPVRLQTISKMASTNGKILFGAVLGALIFLVVQFTYQQHSDTYQWWFWVCFMASSVAVTRLFVIYRRPRLYNIG